MATRAESGEFATSELHLLQFRPPSLLQTNGRYRRRRGAPKVFRFLSAKMMSCAGRREFGGSDAHAPRHPSKRWPAGVNYSLGRRECCRQPIAQSARRREAEEQKSRKAEEQRSKEAKKQRAKEERGGRTRSIPRRPRLQSLQSL